MDEQSTIDQEDQAFMDELNKRLTTLIHEGKVPSTQWTVSKLVKKAVDSMIVDKIIGPTFHQEVKTTVEINRVTGVMDVSFALFLHGEVKEMDVTPVESMDSDDG